MHCSYCVIASTPMIIGCDSSLGQVIDPCFADLWSLAMISWIYGLGYVWVLHTVRFHHGTYYTPSWIQGHLSLLWT